MKQPALTLVLAATLALMLAGCDSPPTPETMPQVNEENCKQENIARIKDLGTQQAFASMCVRRGGEFKPSPKRGW